jgi:hypothetical protein
VKNNSIYRIQILIPDVGSSRNNLMLHASGYVSGIMDDESLAQIKYFEREFLII